MKRVIDNQQYFIQTFRYNIKQNDYEIPNLHFLCVIFNSNIFTREKNNTQSQRHRQES